MVAFTKGPIQRGSGTGDTGDTLLKQTRSPPPAPPSGQEHAFASGRTRGRPGRPPAGPAPPARKAPTLPRVPLAAPSPPDARTTAPTPRGPRASPPRRPRLPPRVPLSAPLSPFASKPSGNRGGFESLSAHCAQQPGSLTAGGLFRFVGVVRAGSAGPRRLRRQGFLGSPSATANPSPLNEREYFARDCGRPKGPAARRCIGAR
jgi:hypothetical protein